MDIENQPSNTIDTYVIHQLASACPLHKIRSVLEDYLMEKVCPMDFIALEEQIYKFYVELLNARLWDDSLGERRTKIKHAVDKFICIFYSIQNNWGLYNLEE